MCTIRQGSMSLLPPSSSSSSSSSTTTAGITSPRSSAAGSDPASTPGSAAAGSATAAVVKSSEPMVGGVAAVAWGEEGYQLVAAEAGMVGEVAAGVRGRQAGRLVQFAFARQCSSKAVAGSSHVWQAMAGADRVLLVQSNEEEELRVQHLVIPQTYMGVNWPVRHVAASDDGSYLAVAGRRGVILHNLRSNKWRVFGDVMQERAVKCEGLLWVGKIIIVCNHRVASHSYELCLYPRFHLDESSLLCRQPLPARPIALDAWGDYILVATPPFDIKVFHMHVEGDVSPLHLPTVQVSFAAVRARYESGGLSLALDAWGDYILVATPPFDIKVFHMHVVGDVSPLHLPTVQLRTVRELSIMSARKPLAAMRFVSFPQTFHFLLPAAPSPPSPCLTPPPPAAHTAHSAGALHHVSAQAPCLHALSISLSNLPLVSCLLPLRPLPAPSCLLPPHQLRTVRELSIMSARKPLVAMRFVPRTGDADAQAEGERQAGSEGNREREGEGQGALTSSSSEQRLCKEGAQQGAARRGAGTQATGKSGKSGKGSIRDPLAEAMRRQPTKCMLLRTDGDLSLLDLDSGSERALVAGVENFWLTQGGDEAAAALIEEVPWWAYGHRGMQPAEVQQLDPELDFGRKVWYPSLYHDASGQPAEVQQLDPELDFDREVYPLGVSPAAGVIVGVSQRLSLSSCAEMPCFEPTPQAQPILPCLLRHLLQAQPILPCLLRHLLQRNKMEEAVQLAHLSATRPHFSHSLEWLLFTIFDAETSRSVQSGAVRCPWDQVQGGEEGTVSAGPGMRIDSALGEYRDVVCECEAAVQGGKEGPESAGPCIASARRRRKEVKKGPSLLDRACELIRHFGEYRDVVVSVARKTDSRHWPDLFASAGNSNTLFEECFENKQYRTATCYILVLENPVVDKLEGPTIGSANHASHLPVPSCSRLSNCALPCAPRVPHQVVEKLEGPTIGQQSALRLLQGCVLLRSGREFSQAKEEDERASALPAAVRFLLRSGREYSQAVEEDERASESLLKSFFSFGFTSTAPKARGDVLHTTVKHILGEKATALMSSKELRQLVAFVKGTQFDFTEFLRSDRGRSIRLEDFPTALRTIRYKIALEGNLQSRLDAEFLLAHVRTVGFHEWTVVLATLLQRSEVLAELFQNDMKLWTAYVRALKAQPNASQYDELLAAVERDLTAHLGPDNPALSSSSLAIPATTAPAR
ncbi:unnamed protein product [Closterium sp. NIES-64]|nr:unnamed protein product [Closterium sp. NIES-64]